MVRMLGKTLEQDGIDVGDASAAMSELDSQGELGVPLVFKVVITTLSQDSEK